MNGPAFVRGSGLPQDLANHTGIRDAVVGQRLVAAMVGPDEARVVDAELMEQGGVQVGDAHAICAGTLADFVRLSLYVSTFESAAGQDRAEGVAVLVPPQSILRNG